MSRKKCPAGSFQMTDGVPLFNIDCLSVGSDYFPSLGIRGDNSKDVNDCQRCRQPGAYPLHLGQVSLRSASMVRGAE